MSTAPAHLSDDYLEYMASPEWAELRRAALKRDGHACRVCNSSAQLDVHHRTYQRFGHEDLGDLTTLCRWCHDVFHEAKSRRPRTGKTPPPINYEPYHRRQPNQRTKKKKAKERAQTARAWEKQARRNEDLTRALGSSVLPPVARVPTTRSEVQAAILDALQAGPLTGADLAHRTGVEPQIVGQQLARLRGVCKVEKGNGRWRLPEDGR